MDRLSFKLAVILGLQLVLALILWAGGPDYNAFKAKEPLLTFDPAKVDRIEIAENGANSVALVKEDGKWVIPSSAGFPADAAKVSGLLTKLAGLKKGWPAATSAGAAKRFKVAEDAFERRIVLKSGGGTAGEILLGTAPNFKSVNARASGSNNIYSVAFSAYEAGARAGEWMDRSLLNIDRDKIASIGIGGILLERSKDGKFVLAGLAKDQKQDQTATYRLVGALTYPVFDTVAGKGAGALAKVNAPDIEVTIKRTSGDPVVLRYKKEAAGGAYLFASSANDFLFRVSGDSMEPIVKAKRETLIEAPKKAESAPPAKVEKPEKAVEEAAHATPAPAKPGEPEKAEGQSGQATAKPMEAKGPKKAGKEAVHTAPAPAKPGEPKKTEDRSGQTTAEPVKTEGSKKAGKEAVHATPAPAKPGEPEKTEDRSGQTTAEPAKAKEPKKAEGPSGQDAVKPAKVEEPEKARDKGGQAAAEPVKTQQERAQAVPPPPEAKQAEDERFHGAMQPPMLEKPAKVQDESGQAAAHPAKAEEPGKAREEAGHGADAPVKTEEPEKAREGTQAVPAAEPKKAAEEASPAPAQAAKPEGPENGSEAGAEPGKPGETPPPKGD